MAFLLISWSFFIAAEKIRRSFGFHKIIHIIADEHASTNSFADKEAIASKAKSLSVKVWHAVLKLRLLGKYQVKLASELAKEPGYADELAAVTGPDHEYVKRELADINFLRKKHAVALKLSWQQESKKIELDERFFDSLYRDRFGSSMSFIYVKAGRTFDSHRLNVCPYTSKPGESRILIGSGKAASEIVAHVDMRSKSVRQTFKHLEGIVDEFEEVFGALSLSNKDIGSRIDAVIDRAFH